ncbi:UDP-N-acetylglucosamine 2-epimerase (hydrolyzing) [Candidatus Woesearchaeota archaeon]|nr:UDP-N-acetylglucosamine 2-epimerase (hydrolyzing) [Candidatus Woesearchaeota archaeon]
MRKIICVSGTRADYGLMKEVLFLIKKDKDLKLDLVATGMHLMKDFGNTYRDIEQEGFKIKKINSIYKKDDKNSMVIFLSEFINKLAIYVKKSKPDIIVVLGDRAEMLGAAIVGAYLTIPVAHLHGGEVTSTVDEISRHSITKLSHIHLPCTENSAERIRKMGEDKWRIYVVGAPGLDCIVKNKTIPRKKLFKKLSLNDEKTLMVIQHPVTGEDNPDNQVSKTLKAVEELGYQTIIVYPNADAGGRKIIDKIKEFSKNPKFKIFKNIPHDEYLSLLNNIEVLVGNSSSGIIEAASFKLPVVNIGTRQNRRDRTFNVINVGYNEDSIEKAIKKSMSLSFKEKLKLCKNPYGDGKTAPRIIKVLKSIKIDKKLLQKQITY